MKTDNHVDGKRAFKEFKIRKWREERRGKNLSKRFYGVRRGDVEGTSLSLLREIGIFLITS